MNKENDLNVYDMSMTVEIKGVFYEKLKYPINGKRYRLMRSVCADKFSMVTDKATISKLDKIFPKDVVEDDEA